METMTVFYYVWNLSPSYIMAKSCLLRVLPTYTRLFPSIFSLSAPHISRHCWQLTFILSTSIFLLALAALSVRTTTSVLPCSQGHLPVRPADGNNPKSSWITCQICATRFTRATICVVILARCTTGFARARLIAMSGLPMLKSSKTSAHPATECGKGVECYGSISRIPHFRSLPPIAASQRVVEDQQGFMKQKAGSSASFHIWFTSCPYVAAHLASTIGQLGKLISHAVKSVNHIFLWALGYQATWKTVMRKYSALTSVVGNSAFKQCQQANVSLPLGPRRPARIASIYTTPGRCSLGGLLTP